MSAPRELTPAQREEFWTRVYRSDAEEVLETWKERLHTARRICREIARLKGMLTKDRLALGDATQMEPDPWFEPTGIFFREGTRLSDPLVRAIGDTKMPLLPPKEGLNDQHEWFKLAGFVADRLAVRASAQGRVALPQLMSPSLIAIAWPEPHQIIDYEMLEVHRALRLSLDGTPLSVIEQLVLDGYRRHEAHDLVQLGALAARQAAIPSPDTDRSMMVLRLQNIAERSRDRGQSREELAALKALATVQGLVKGGTGDDPDAEEQAMSAFARGLPPPPQRDDSENEED